MLCTTAINTSNTIITGWTKKCGNRLMAAILSNLNRGVATYARCGESFSIHLTTNLPRNFAAKKFFIGSDLTELWS